MQAVRTNEHYLVFLNITNDQLAEIDRKRATIGKHRRMAHHTDTNLLILLRSVGGINYSGHTSSKEGDSAGKPPSRN